MNYSSPTEINTVLKGLGIKLKARWGQNFLINRGAREKIIELINPKDAEIIWEIGAGLGCLTEALLPSVKELIAFEIDRGLIRFLNETFSVYKNFTIIPGDVLKTWKRIAKESKIPTKVVGNLPYGSASALIVSFLQNEFYPEKMVFTVQKELSGRMRAAPGTKNYSSFSILCQYAYQINECFALKPGSFYPAPEIVSMVIELIPRKDPNPPEDQASFFLLVRALFGSRRKTLQNNLLNSGLLKIYKKKLLLQAVELEGIDPGIRSEELPLEAFINLSNRIRELHKDF